MKPVGSRGSSKKYTDNYISPETTFLFFTRKVTIVPCSYGCQPRAIEHLYFSSHSSIFINLFQKDKMYTAKVETTDPNLQTLPTF